MALLTDDEVRQLLNANQALRLELARSQARLQHVAKLQADLAKLASYNHALNMIADELRRENASTTAAFDRLVATCEGFKTLLYHDNWYAIGHMCFIIILCLAIKYGWLGAG